jgi:hypothetical protein
MAQFPPWINDVDIPPLPATVTSPAHVYSATGLALSGVPAASAPVTLVIVNVPAQPVAGKLLAWLVARYDKTVAGDTHVVTLLDGVTNLATYYPGVGTSVVLALSGTVALPANTAKQVYAVIQRQAGGTGNVSTYANYQDTHLDVMWLPS